MVSTLTSVILVVVGLASQAWSYGVILPLYIYPGDNCSGWSPVSTAVAKYPQLDFYLIINPNSGPGGVSTQPDSNYKKCIPALKSSANTNRDIFVIGYVPTGYGSRSTSLVNQDIATYAGWKAPYTPDGIFFDEVASTANLVSQYQNYAWTAWSSFNFVTLNPGTPPDAGYYNAADLIVTSETYYSSFSTSQLSVSSTKPASKQAVILHDAPATPPTSLINQIGSLGVGAVYITDIKEANNPYGTLPTQWNAFVSAVNTENNSL